MPRKRAKRERSSRYQIKAHDVLLSNWVWDAYACWHDRDLTYEPVANDVRGEILVRLNELKSDVDRILRGDAIEPLQEKKAMEVARLLLYGRDEDYRRQVNMTPREVPPEPDLAAVGALIANHISRIANMPVSDWRSKLRHYAMTLMLVPKCEGLSSSAISRMGSKHKGHESSPSPWTHHCTSYWFKSFTARTIDVKRYKG